VLCCHLLSCSIYKLHDEVKDKELELELSWVCDESKRSVHTDADVDHRLMRAACRCVCVRLSTSRSISTELLTRYWCCVDRCSRFSLHVLVPEPYRSEAIRLAQEAKKKEEMDSDDEEEKAEMK
jgi:hypothetical protein